MAASDAYPAKDACKAVCPRCGGEMSKATLKAGNSEAQVVIAGKPDGFLGVIPYTTSPVAARVCTGCGHVELFARNLQDILSIGVEEADG